MTRARPTDVVLGVDGCRAGWIAWEQPLSPGALGRWRLTASVRELAQPRPRVVALDMPIGLLDVAVPGGRICDREARARLGARRSSVFSPPPRACLHATDYDVVRGHGVSIQAFHLLPRLRDVDAFMTPARQEVWRETHPEWAFASLGDGPARHPKRTAAGLTERLERLAQHLPGSEHAFRQGVTAFRRRDVARDDLVDALLLTTVALRMVRGDAQRVPETPPTDTRGLRMELWG